MSSLRLLIIVFISACTFSLSPIARSSSATDLMDACSRFYNPGETLNSCFQARDVTVVMGCQQHYNPEETLNKCFAVRSADLVDSCQSRYNPGATLDACFAIGQRRTN